MFSCISDRMKGHLDIDNASVKKSVYTCQNKDCRGNKMNIIVHENVSNQYILHERNSADILF